MKQYLLSVYQPDGPTPAPEVLATISRDLAALNQDMQAAGGWVFSAGLHPADSATVLRPQNGDVLITDGPFTEGKEHLGGVTVITAPGLDAALAWSKRLSEAPTLPIEVRPFQG